jgi:hypothetical protein
VKRSGDFQEGAITDTTVTDINVTIGAIGIVFDF